jgi:hypothetical protein
LLHLEQELKWSQPEWRASAGALCPFGLLRDLGIRHVPRRSRGDLPDARLAAFEELDKKIIRSGNHHVSEPGFLANRIPKLKPTGLHSLDQAIEIVSLNTEVMEGATAFAFRRLVVQMYERST